MNRIAINTPIQPNFPVSKGKVLEETAQAKGFALTNVWRGLSKTAQGFMTWEKREVKDISNFFSLKPEDWIKNFKAILTHNPMMPIDSLLSKDLYALLPQKNYALEGYSSLSEQLEAKQNAAWRNWNCIGIALGAGLLFFTAMLNNYNCLYLYEKFPEAAIKECKFEWYGQISDPARIAQLLTASLIWTLPCCFMLSLGDFGLRGSLKKKWALEAYKKALDNISLEIAKYFCLYVSKGDSKNAHSLFVSVKELENNFGFFKERLHEELGLSIPEVDKLLGSFDMIFESILKSDLNHLFMKDRPSNV